MGGCDAWAWRLRSEAQGPEESQASVWRDGAGCCVFAPGGGDVLAGGKVSVLTLTVGGQGT